MSQDFCNGVADPLVKSGVQRATIVYGRCAKRWQRRRIHRRRKKRRSFARYRFCFLHLCREPLLPPVAREGTNERTKEREREREKESKRKRKGGRKSGRSSPSSKAEEAFRAGLRIQSGRIIRSSVSILSLSLSIFLSASSFSVSSRFSSRFVDSAIGSCAECPS